MSQRRVRLAAVLLAGCCTVFGLSFLTGVIAQEPPPLAISKVAHTDVAVPDSELVYAITITNTGTNSLNNVVIKDAVPAGTTFFETRNYPQGWAAGGVDVGEVGDIFWVAVIPLAPQETVQVEFSVLVRSDVQGIIVNEAYQVSLSDNDPVVTGSPVVVRVVEPTPTPMPSPTPLPASPTPTSQPSVATAQGALPSPTPTTPATPTSPLPTAVPIAAEPPSPAPAIAPSPDLGREPTALSPLPLAVGAMAVVAGGIVLLAWLVRRKTK